MDIEQGLLAWLQENTGLSAWWLERPNTENKCIVYQCLSPGVIGSNLANPKIRRDLFSITVYHDKPDAGKKIASDLIDQLHKFSGDLGGVFVQFIDFQNAFDQKLNNESGIPIYQFNRDFIITY